MSWETLKNRKENAGKKWLSFKTVSEHLVVFKGEVSTFFQSYPGKERRKEWAEGYNFRFEINVITKENEQYVAKIFSGGSNVATSLYDVKEEYGLDSLFKLKKTGTGKDTKYSILFQRKLTVEEQGKFNLIPLAPLSGFEEPKEFMDEGLEEPPMPSEDQEPPESEMF